MRRFPGIACLRAAAPSSMRDVARSLAPSPWCAASSRPSQSYGIHSLNARPLPRVRIPPVNSKTSTSPDTADRRCLPSGWREESQEEDHCQDGNRGELPSSQGRAFYSERVSFARGSRFYCPLEPWASAHSCRKFGVRELKSSPVDRFSSGYSSGCSGTVRRVSGSGFTALNARVYWGQQNLDFFILGLDPDGPRIGDGSALSAIKAKEELRPDLVLLGIGYLDYDKIQETFSQEELLRSRQAEPINAVVSRDNGQFIPIIQHLLLSGTPYYIIGRDRLVEMGALGRELLRRPTEFYSLLWKLRRGKREKEPITASLKKVLSEDSSEFCFLKIHQYLLEWTDSPHAAPEPVPDFNETKLLEKWVIGRNKSECQLRLRAKQLELARMPLPMSLKQKPNIRILVVCDSALQERLAQRLANNLCKLYGTRPSFERMFDLQNTSATRFHLCLMLFIILPTALLCRAAWKGARSAYTKWWPRGGGGVSIDSDEVLSRLAVPEQEASDD